MPGNRAAVILAAGHGTRMKSQMSKVLHPVGGRSMLAWSMALAEQLNCDRTIVVHGSHNLDVKRIAESALGPGSAVLQDPPQGTGHAVAQATDALAEYEGDVIVLYADTPLITAGVCEAAFGALKDGADVVVLGIEAADPGAYGRLIEGPDQQLVRIVEAKEATPEELAVTLCNSGVMVAPAKKLFQWLSRVTNDNAKGEFYLTDIIGFAVGDGGNAKAVRADETDVLGVNSRVELAQAEAAFQARARRALMVSGVTMIAPETVYVSYDTAIEPDSVIEPHVVFGPGVRVGANCRVKAFSHLEGCTLDEGVDVGPYARIRPGTTLAAGTKIGNFVEIKNSRLGEGVKAGHLSYLGDADVGARTNIGAGTVTCNYDGYLKHRTLIGEDVFVGSDTMLVAPVTVGAGANTGSGSTITRDVPAGALAVERAEQRNIEGAATRFRARKQAEKAGKATGS